MYCEGVWSININKTAKASRNKLLKIKLSASDD